MRYFKDNKDGVYISENILDGFIEISHDEYQLLNPLPPPSPDELAAIAKQTKLEALSTLTVTTSSGKVFDGNETARINMLSAIQSATFLNQTQAGWKLADNTVAIVNVDEIKEALALSIQRVGEIVTA